MAKFRAYAEYSAESDAIYVLLSGGEIEKSVCLDDFRNIDYSAEGAVVGVEFLGVRGGVDLADVPYSHKVEKLIGDLNLGIKIFA